MLPVTAVKIVFLDVPSHVSCSFSVIVYDLLLPCNTMVSDEISVLVVREIDL